MNAILKMARAQGKIVGRIDSRLEATFAQQALAEKLPPWVREYAFHQERNWRFDFAWPSIRFAIEVQGGCHTVREQFYKDIQKRAHALLAGWDVLEIGPREVRSGQAVAWAKSILWERT